MPVIGATRKREVWPFFQPLSCGISKRVFTHTFLYIPECPMPLLGKDWLNKLNAQISFDKGDIQIHTPEDKSLKAQVFMLQVNKEGE